MGVLTALAVRTVMWPGISMVIGMIIHLVVSPRHRRQRAEGRFRLRRVENVYMDIVRIIEAVKDPAG